MNQKQLGLIRAHALNVLSVAPDDVDTKDKLALLAEIDHLRGVIANRWIPVAERLPEVYTEVILTTRYGGKFVGYLCDDGRWESEGAPVLGVTHWQPSPEGPAVE